MLRSHRALLALSLFAWGISAALAQSYPTRAIRLLVGYAPGGPVDTTARIIAPALQAELGQPIVVENRPGAGGVIAAEAVARAAPDGYLLYFAASPTQTISPHVQKSVPFDITTDFAYISVVVDYTNVLIVAKDAPFQDVAALLTYARANPGKVTYGSAGMGASNHLAGELLAQTAGVTMVHVPYKGNAPAVADVLGGKITFMFDITGTTKGFVEGGRARALAVAARERNRSLPKVPTMTEAGVRDFDVTGWFGLQGPSALPRPIVDRLNAAVRKALADSTVGGRLSELGYDPRPTTPADFAVRVKTEYDLWQRVTRGIKFD